MKIPDKDIGPHQEFCDCLVGISEACNCIASSYIEKIEELESGLQEIAKGHDISRAVFKHEDAVRLILLARKTLIEFRKLTGALCLTKDELERYEQKYD